MEYFMFAFDFKTVAFVLLIYLVTGAIYRLWFHPLSKYPGPRIAALTTWYEGWYDCLKYKGRFTFHLKDLHEKYGVVSWASEVNFLLTRTGSIVRIGPNELHVKDPDYYAELYNMSNKLDKYDFYYSMLGNPTATFPTIKQEDHKIRRGALNPFFSTAAVVRFQPVIQQVTDRLTSRIEKAIKDDKSIPVFFAYRCLTVDIICEYLYGKQLHLVEREDWGQSFYSAWRSLWAMSPLIRQFPWILEAFRLTPRSLLAKTNPEALEVLDMEQQTTSWTREVLDADPEKMRSASQKTVYWEVANSQSIPQNERTFQRLAVDGSNTLSAGFETTGSALAYLTYHVLNTPDIHKKLYEELVEAIPDPATIPSYQVLEKLPYFQAVVKEALRYGVGAYGRLSRVNRTQAMRYKDWVIPAGCAVGMSPLYVLWDPVIFPQPDRFKPERWLAPDANEKLEPYFVVFGRGQRNCVGQNLAWAELYITFAAVVRRFPTLKLYDTSSDDVVAVHDFFGGMWKFEKGNMGLQVKG